MHPPTSKGTLATLHYRRLYYTRKLHEYIYTVATVVLYYRYNILQKLSD